MATALQMLQQNTYPGRGILAGTAPDGRAVFAYFLTGRSENSRNRLLREENGCLHIDLADPAKLEDASLICYTPVRPYGAQLIVSNGDQTETIYEALQHGISFRHALAQRCFEPDAPHYTPRISALLQPSGYQMSLLRRTGCDGSCLRLYWHYQAVAGIGHLLCTYRGNAAPLPSFTGAPLSMALPATPDELCQQLWTALPPEKRIALCVRYTDLCTGQASSCLKNIHTGA